jgi:hypothetical protein
MDELLPAFSVKKNDFGSGKFYEGALGRRAQLGKYHHIT